MGTAAITRTPGGDPWDGVEGGPGRQVKLADGISIRPEPFGGLIYSFDARRLQVVRSKAAIDVVIQLVSGSDIDAVSRELLNGGGAADLAEARAFVERTVKRLEELGVLTWTTN